MPTSSDRALPAARLKAAPAQGRRLALALALAGATMTVAPPALAAGAAGLDAFEGLLPADASPIADAELARMHGRFVTAGQVMYFGIEMVSEWSTAAGDSVTAGLNLAMDFSSRQPQISYRPTVHVLPRQGADPLANPQGEASIHNQGMADTTGLGQIIQVTGDGNSIRNGFTLSVNTGGRLATNDAGNTASTGVEGLTAAVHAETGALGLRINMPGHGEVSQLMGSTGIQQSAAVWGHANQIRSHINLQMDFRQRDLLIDQSINPRHLTRGLPGQ